MCLAVKQLKIEKDHFTALPIKNIWKWKTDQTLGWYI